MLNKLLPITLGLVSVIVLGIIFVSFSENEPETTTLISQSYTETLLSPSTFQATSYSTKISPNSFQGISEIDSIKNSDMPALVQKADAITSTQDSLSVTQHTPANNLQKNHAFDSSGNFFVGLSGKVGRIDISTDTQKTWTIPNDQTTRDSGGVVDSSGFYYFVIQTVEQPTIWKIAKLNHNTDTFTEWPMTDTVKRLTIDSSDNLYFTFDSAGADDVFFNKLDTTTNTLTSYVLPLGIPFSLSGSVWVQDSGLFYLDTAGDNEVGILRFNPSTNEITHWGGIS